MPEGSRRAGSLRGQNLFNSKPINITGVGGLNDDLKLGSIPGTCGTCHGSPNVGNHSVAAALNIGVGDVNSPLDVSYLPVITLQNKATLEMKTTTDPGRAMISGLWKDVARLKGPILRGLAGRAPEKPGCRPRSVQFADTDTPEQREGKLIVELQSDGSGFAAPRIAGELSHDFAIDAHADHLIPRLDVHAVQWRSRG